MRTPEEQEQFLEHGRFDETAAGTPTPPPKVYRWMRIGCVAIMAVVAAVVIVTVALTFLGRHITKVIVADQRTAYSDRGQSAVYGFSVEVYRWNREGFRLRFGGGDRFNDTRLDFPTLRLVSLQQHSWLAEQRAVILEVEVEHAGDSLHNSRSMFFLYDFARGDLRSCGLERVWTLQGQRATAETASSCDELQALAAKLR